jgi:hypothetical protein
MILSIMAYSRLKCPRCSADFGQESRFLDHITDIHGISDHELLYVEIVLQGIKPTCSCGCEKPLPWSGWKKGYTSKFLRGHNALVDSVYLNKERQVEFAEKRREGFKSGRNKIWNTGLTKETDVRVKASSEKISNSLNEGYASGSIVDWRLLDVEKARIVAQKQSLTKQAMFANGNLIPWNKGKTKNNHPSLAMLAKSISQNYIVNPSASAKRLTPIEFIERIEKQDTFSLLSDPESYRNKYQYFDLQCRACQTVTSKNLMMLKHTPVCFTCHPKESKGQLEIFEFVKSLTPDAILSDRDALGGLELDVYVPSKQFAIEYDGLYWHSEACNDVDRAAKKTKTAFDRGIRLFRVFEDEWRDKRSLIESMIKHRIGLVTNSIGARKCGIRELSTKERRDFIERCHLDGDVKSKMAWGLFYDGKLVSALSTRRAFHNLHKDRLEVARFCSEPNLSIPGALARLSSYALRWAKANAYDGLMTYVDQRIGQAKGYQLAGFKLIRETKPRFWWTDYQYRYDRFSVRADSKNQITQEQAANDAGVVKIWGCSNMVLELK